MECLRNQLLFLTFLWDSEFQDDSLSRYLLITSCVQDTKQGTCSTGMDFVLVEFTYWLGREKYVSRQTKKVITNPCVINETTRNWEREEQEETVRQGLSEELFEPRQDGEQELSVHVCCADSSSRALRQGAHDVLKSLDSVGWRLESEWLTRGKSHIIYEFVAPLYRVK